MVGAIESKSGRWNSLVASSEILASSRNSTRFASNTLSTVCRKPGLPKSTLKCSETV